MKNYTKKHETKKALDSHIAKIKARGGSYETTGMTIKYSFPDKKIFAETKPPYSEKIEVGMYVNTPSENDSTRPSKWRLKVVDIKMDSEIPRLRTVTLEDGNKYSPAYLYYPSFKK